MIDSIKQRRHLNLQPKPSQLRRSTLNPQQQSPVKQREDVALEIQTELKRVNSQLEMIKEKCRQSNLELQTFMHKPSILEQV
jgi:flagellar motor switch/type III secretory pathway protein FliN